MSWGSVAVAGLLVLLMPCTAGAAGARDAPTREAASRLTLAGCDANVPLMRLLVRAFMERRPEVGIRLQTVGSTNGIALAAAGAIDIGLVSRPLRASEDAHGLTFRAYARTAIVVAADPSVPDVGLTAGHLLGFYRGTRQRWASGADVVVLTREEGDSSVAALKERLPGFAEAYAAGSRTSHLTVLYSEPMMHEALLTLPFAVGLSDLGTVTIERLPVGVLAVDGIAPTLANLASGRYPFAKTLAMVWQEARLPDAARALVDFVRSAEGASIMTAHGYLPLR